MAIPGAKVTVGPAFFGSDAAPFVYFDGAYAVLPINGEMIIELAARTLMPAALTPDAPVKIRPVTVAHLRCSLDAAKQLRDALDSQLATIEKKVEAAKPPSH